MLAEPIQKMLDDLQTHRQEEDIDLSQPRVTVNELTSKAGKFYERLRYLFDYKEEHTIRRSAVERQLRRQLAVGKPDQIGIALVQELIRGGYLQNRMMSEQTGYDIQHIVDKYMALNAHNNPRVRKHLISLAATEIDRLLKPQSTAQHVCLTYYQTIRLQIEYTGHVTSEELDQQIYIACRRALLEDDPDMLFYALWHRHVPDWPSMSTPDDLTTLAGDVPEIFQSIERELKHPLGWLLIPKLRNYTIYFLLIKKILEDYGVETQQIFEDSAKLRPTVEEILKQEYEEQFTKARKSGLRALIYIFFTKMLVALVLEYPSELFFYGHANLIALGSNVVIHPFLLFLMTRGLPRLQPDHIRRAADGVEQVVTTQELETIHIKPRNSSIVLNTMLLLLYFILFLLSFGIIVSVLNAVGFTIISIALFLIFLTLVSYFGFRIRHNAKKWRVSTPDRTLTMLWRILTLPIVRAGRWLSRTFSTINVFVFLMDFIIETPFKLVLGLLDSFISFLREKEEELY